jgi:UDP-3-O-[3-hydroxymyristoyl] glucosamine N-acyltransferase
MATTYTLASIVYKLGGELSGDENVLVSKLSSLAHAKSGAISFLTDTKYTQALKSTLASAVILKPEHRELTPLPCIVTENPYVYFAKLSALFNPRLGVGLGIHATACVDSSVAISEDVSIGAGAIIAANVVVGPRVVIGAGSVVEEGVVLGDDTVLEPRVVVKHGVAIGKRCHLFSGCVVGNDGFGYAEEAGTWVKIPQVGGVQIGDDVDIGANTTIDRGALDDTVIEDGVKLDNLIQIAHNCIIGAHTVIAGCVGVAGSAVIGKHCRIGGAAMILGHMTIADGVTISPGSMITRSIAKAGTYTALMPFQSHENWLKTAANIRHLDKMMDRIKLLELALKHSKNNIND